MRPSSYIVLDSYPVSNGVPPAWAEQTANNAGNPHKSRQGGTKGGPRASDFDSSADPSDPDLVRVIGAWPKLPAEVKATTIA